MTNQQNKVRVAIIGVDNCASSFVQGVEYYKNASDDVEVPGLMHVNLGGYHINDIEFSKAAFDAVRCAKLALDRGISGPLHEASAYFMKSPPVQYTDEQARVMVEEFISGV